MFNSYLDDTLAKLYSRDVPFEFLEFEMNEFRCLGVGDNALNMVPIPKNFVTNPNARVRRIPDL